MKLIEKINKFLKEKYDMDAEERYGSTPTHQDMLKSLVHSINDKRGNGQAYIEGNYITVGWGSKTEDWLYAKLDIGYKKDPRFKHHSYTVKVLKLDVYDPKQPLKDLEQELKDAKTRPASLDWEEMIDWLSQR